jgi:hypothetical protein
MVLLRLFDGMRLCGCSQVIALSLFRNGERNDMLRIVFVIIA